jgi:hypothetical protein
LAQIEKRFTIYREEYNEHIALCNAAIGKLVDLAEIRVCFMRVLNAERKRAVKSENSLAFVVTLRKIAYKVSVMMLVSLFVGLLSMVVYWRFIA